MQKTYFASMIKAKLDNRVKGSDLDTTMLIASNEHYRYLLITVDFLYLR